MRKILAGKPWKYYRQGLDCPGMVIAQMVVMRYLDDTEKDLYFADTNGNRIACIEELLDLCMSSGIVLGLTTSLPTSLVLRLFNTPGPERIHVERVASGRIWWGFDGDDYDLPETSVRLLQQYVDREAWLSIEPCESVFG